MDLDKIIAALPTELVELPDLGCSVTMRGLGGGERLAIFERFEAKPVELQSEVLATMCIEAPGGAPVFEAEQIPYLSVGTLKILQGAARRLNGDDVEGAAGNSDGDRSGDSSSHLRSA